MWFLIIFYKTLSLTRSPNTVSTRTFGSWLKKSFYVKSYHLLFEWQIKISYREVDKGILWPKFNPLECSYSKVKI